MAGAHHEDGDAEDDSRLPKYDCRPAAVYREVAAFALPMLATLAADPLASLVDTAYVGHLGAVPLAGVGMALSIFNSITKLFNAPLLSVTTSTVAVAHGKAHATRSSVSVAASSAIVMALVFGAFEAAVLAGGASFAASLWGATPGSQLRQPTLEFLYVRAAGSPATVLMLVLQGIFRGLSDTRTPFYGTILCNGLNVALEPFFIWTVGLGVRGSALATLIAQVIPCIILLLYVHRKYPLQLSPRQIRVAELMALFAPTGYLVLRTLSVMAVYAVATSLVARAGPEHAAAHQICFQIWLACSLMADAIAAAAQTLLARSMAVGELAYGRMVVRCTVTLGAVLGALLTLFLAAGHNLLPNLFTVDAEVRALLPVVMPFVIATQLINSLAFVWDGVLYGVGGFKYASGIMLLCAAPALGTMFVGTLFHDANAQLAWVWAGLTVVMIMRTLTIWLPYWIKLYPFKVLFRRPQPLLAATAVDLVDGETDERKRALLAGYSRDEEGTVYDSCSECGEEGQCDCTLHRQQQLMHKALAGRAVASGADYFGYRIPGGAGGAGYAKDKLPALASPDLIIDMDAAAGATPDATAKPEEAGGDNRAIFFDTANEPEAVLAPEPEPALAGLVQWPVAGPVSIPSASIVLSLMPDDGERSAASSAIGVGLLSPAPSPNGTYVLQNSGRTSSSASSSNVESGEVSP